MNTGLKFYVIHIVPMGNRRRYTSYVNALLDMGYTVTFSHKDGAVLTQETELFFYKAYVYMKGERK